MFKALYLQKKTIYLLLILAVIILAGFFIVLKITVNKEAVSFKDKQKLTVQEINDWQSYQNQKYNYSFKYPKNWQLTEDSKKLKQAGLELGVPLLARAEIFGIENQQADFYRSLYIFLNQRPKLDNGEFCQSLDECVEIYSQPLAGLEDYQLAYSKKSKFLDQEAIVQKVDQLQASWSRLYTFILKDDNFYVIRFTSNLDKFELSQAAFEQIISTFKFE